MQPHIVRESTPIEKSNQWLAKLQDQGYRLTNSRRTIVDLIAEADRSMTPAELYKVGRERNNRLGLVSVYRTLEKLEELGLVQRVHRPDGCHAYISAIEGHQHLLLCESCGRVEVFHGDDLKDFSRRLEGESGFEIHEHWLQFFGLCSLCR